jgi:pilus assembly protein CpaC
MRMRTTPIGWPLAVALTAATVATPAAAPAQTTAVAARSANVVQLATNRGKLVTLARPMSDLFVASSDIADVQVRSPTQLYIFGKKSGETTVSATTKGGAVVYSATVRVGNNFDSIGQMLRLALPESTVTATTLNGLVLLTGTIATPDEGAEAERLVQAFVGDGIKVLSRLKTATPLQVNLQVRIAEVSRSFVKNIGVNLATVDATGGFKFGLSQGSGGGGQFTPGGPLGVGFTKAPDNGSLIKSGNGSTLGAAGKLLGLDVLGSLDLGETIGQVSTLANPNLTALSGETATFLAGGEVPIPISQGLGAVSVEYKQYGISLAYTPTVLSNGQISLRVRPEVSQLTSDGAVQMNGTTIPALTTRRAETTLILGSGQSMMIGGLLQNSHNNTIDKTPGLGDIPILGALFRSNAWKRNESELVIVITPYLVKPVNANDIALPTDGYKGPTDAQRVFLGQLGDGTSGAERPKPRLVSPAPPVGAPVAGAAGPVAPAPVPLDPQLAAVSSKKRGAAATPGFSD